MPRRKTEVRRHPLCRAPLECACPVCDPALHPSREEMDAAQALAREAQELEDMLLCKSIRAVMSNLPVRMERRKKALRLMARLERLGYVLFIRHGSLAIEPADTVPEALRGPIYDMRTELEELCDERNTNPAPSMDVQDTGLEAG